MAAQSAWSSYRNLVFKNCSSQESGFHALDYWRGHLFAVTIVYILPLSLIALLPGIYIAFIENLTLLLIADTFAVLSLLLIAFVPGISIWLRKFIFIVALYFVSIVLLYYLGTYGPGLIYLLAVNVLVVLIAEEKYGYWIVAINTLVCVIGGFAIYHQWWNLVVLTPYDLTSWIGVSSNLIFLSLLAVILIPILFDGLQSTIEEQDRLKEKLEENQKKLRESVAQLEDKNQELEDFAYSASHDLKEPLRMVRGFLKLLDDRYTDKVDEQGRKFIYYAVDGAERMAEFLDDLLEFSRVGRMYASFEEVDVNKVLEIVEQSFAYKKLENDAEIKYIDLPVIHAVPVSVKMLFQNLIGNGLKYQLEGNKPVVIVTAEDMGSHWQFEVKDNGIGIHEDYFEQIFQLFNRLHSKEQYSGTGMGLAICRKIVNQHGGKIWVESSLGKGAVFKFTIEKRKPEY